MDKTRLDYDDGTIVYAIDFGGLMDVYAERDGKDFTVVVNDTDDITLTMEADLESYTVSHTAQNGILTVTLTPNGLVEEDDTVDTEEQEVEEENVDETEEVTEDEEESDMDSDEEADDEE